MKNKSNKEKVLKNLIKLFGKFKNKPSYLAKFLIDNNAFDEKFISKIIQSEKLNSDDKSSSDQNQSESTEYFKSISQMNEYYNSLIEPPIVDQSSREEMYKELKSKLDIAIKEERYEEAIRIRDYLQKNGYNKDGNNLK